MNILSLFDGISCAQIALNRIGVKKYKYYASEVDKYAIQITQKNYPNTIQLGDVNEVSAKNLPKIDLLIGGSPCQGFSLAGKRLNFDDPRSKLFFQFLRLLKESKPKNFLLENVKMRKDIADEITSLLEVEPIEINSALVSAQNRKRLYWTNIPGIKQPDDKGILLKDILEDGDAVLVHNIYGGFKENKCRVFEEKSPTIRTSSGGGHLPSIFNGTKEHAQSLPLPELRKLIRKLHPIECERLQTVPDNYTEGISNTQRYKALGNGFTVDVIAHILKSIND